MEWRGGDEPLGVGGRLARAGRRRAQLHLHAHLRRTQHVVPSQYMRHHTMVISTFILAILPAASSFIRLRES